jgi:hypothetical protein
MSPYLPQAYPLARGKDLHLACATKPLKEIAIENTLPDPLIQRECDLFRGGE